MTTPTQAGSVPAAADKQYFSNIGPPTVTLIQSDSRANKIFTRAPDGTLHKDAIGWITAGVAWSVPVPTAEAMVNVLQTVTQTNNTVVCAGAYINDPGCNFRIMTEPAMAAALGRNVGDKSLGGVQVVNGVYTAARLKRGTHPSEWILFDADSPPGIPDDWAAMDIQQRMEQWDELLPGLSSCERIELRSSSSRVRLIGTPEGQATHAWVRVSDPSMIALMKAHLSIEMVNRDKSFTFKKHSKVDPERVVGNESRGVFDLAVFDNGRLTFCAAPTADIPGYVVDGADIKIVNPGGGVLDISWITMPDEVAISLYKSKTNIKLDMKIGGNGYLSIRTTGQLTWETEIDSRGEVKSFSAWAAGLQPGDKIRCEAPFRESYSEAAFISLNSTTGLPQVHDIGNGCTYMLQPTIEELFGAPTPEMLAAAAASAASTASGESTQPPGKPVVLSTDDILAKLHNLSATTRLDEMEANMANESWIFPRIALSGQITLIYARPNGGKTLLFLKFLVDGIREKRFKAEDIYYINADDNYKGILTKGRIAEKHGFAMISPAESGVKATDVLSLFHQLALGDGINGKIIILDTLKKFADMMDKKSQAALYEVLRVMVAKGATVIMAGHVNKHLDANDELVYEGTADTLNDIDCAYALYSNTDSNDAEQVVEFRKTKSRGDNCERVSYQYKKEPSFEGKIIYEDLMETVTVMGANAAQVAAKKQLGDELLLEYSVEDHFVTRLLTSQPGMNQTQILEAYAALGSDSIRGETSRRRIATALGKLIGIRWKVKTNFNTQAKEYEVIPRFETSPGETNS